MPVLSSARIKHRLSLPVKDPSSLVITPLLKGGSFDADSIDLRLGCHFILPQVPPEPAFLPSSESSTRSQMRVHVPYGEYLVVPAHQTVLGATLEFVKLPYDVSGQILTKSSVARTFTIIETAPWIHPFYRGCLTLEIANVSNTPLLLYPGRFIGQLILLAVEGAEPPVRLRGTYIGPVFPEVPKFRDPEQDLALLGVPIQRPSFRR